jgi:hypothetical protein
MAGGALKPKSIFIVSLACLALGLPCLGQKRHSAASQPVAQDAQPTPAGPPPTLAQLPATPPQVTFQGGQLTISAQNSTLGDILKAVRAQTGATIELPGTASERVVGQFGPAPARDVLASLLNGSHFNYMLLGSATDPNALDRVILMAKSGGGAVDSAPQQPTQQAAAYNQAVYNRPTAMPMAAPGGNVVTVEGQDAENQDEATDDSADAATDDTADDQTDQTDQTDDQAAADDQQQQPQQDGQQQVKTPEQLLQELQQRQQQMQQQGIQPGVQPGIQPGVPPGMRQFPNPGVPNQPGGDATPPH